jgi:hypothetical protein
VTLAGIIADKPESVAKVVRTRARGLERDCPHGVAQGFHITSDKSEPRRRACNLFTKDDCRAALADEFVPCGPEMAFVVEAKLLSDSGERPAGTRAGPAFSIITPTGETQACGPSADACEEVTLIESDEVGWSNSDN